MSKNAKNIDALKNKKFFFGTFDSSEDFQRIGIKSVPKETMKAYDKEVSSNGVSVDNPRFYKAKTIDELRGDIDTFIDMPLVKNTIDSFDGVLEKIDMGGAFEKARLIATRNKQGIFDFGLASKGLYRPSEYYSQDLADRFPNEFESFNEPSGLVPPDFVKNKKVDGKVYFWYSRGNEDFICQQRQYGVTRALDENPDLETEMFGDMLILKKPNKNLRFASTYDKCYLMHKKQGGKAKSVDLYVVQGGLGGTSERAMILKTMPVLLASKILEEAGIKTRIYATRAYTSGENYFFFTYPVKNYGQELDWNELALNVGDPRIFRYKTWLSIAGILAKDYPIDENGNKIDWNRYNGGWGFGETLYGGRTMDEVFERYKTFIGEKTILGDSNKKLVDRTLMIIGGVEDADELEYANEKDANKMILEEFYRIMDTVDFQFNQTEKVADRIINRELENKKVMTDIKTYMNDILKRAYSLPKSGQYAASKSDQEKVFGVLDDKLDKLFNYYQK